MKDKISVHKITIFHLRIQSQKIYDHSYMYLIITRMFTGPFHMVTFSEEKRQKNQICFFRFSTNWRTIDFVTLEMHKFTIKQEKN